MDNLNLEVVDRRGLVVSAFESRSSDSDPHSCALLRKEHMEKYHLTYCRLCEYSRPCPHPTVPHEITIMAQTRKIQLADPREGERDLPIEVLIGGDHYLIVKNASTIRLT